MTTISSAANLLSFGEHKAEQIAARDVADLNYQYWYGARTLALHSIEEATLRYGIDRDTAQALTEASVQQIEVIANQQTVAFRPRGNMRSLTAMMRGDITARARYVLSSVSVSD